MQMNSLVAISLLQLGLVDAFSVTSPSSRNPSTSTKIGGAWTTTTSLSVSTTPPSASQSISMEEGDDSELGLPPIIVDGKNIEITEALADYVDKRVRAPLSKLSGNGRVRSCHVVLSVSKNPKVTNGHRCELVTNLKGTTFVSNVESPDMYASIDSAAHALQRKLRKFKERRQEGWHRSDDEAEEAFLQEALEDIIAETEEVDEVDDDDAFVDPEAPTVTKIRSFQLAQPVSLQEAIFALDYVDHDFYVFRNEETNEISVVYKRHGGGVGLIEP